MIYSHSFSRIMRIDSIKNNDNHKINIWLYCLPLLVLYTSISLLFAKSEIFRDGDEIRYYIQALNIVNGTYDQLALKTALENGPGYPLIISFIIKLRIPLIFAKILNGIFLYLSFVLSYKTIKEYTTHKNALLFTYLMALYYPIWEMLPQLMTESLTWLLVSTICYLIVKLIKQDNLSWKYIFLGALAVFYLVMTKVIFGYVILCMLFISILWFLKSDTRLIAKKLFFTILLSLIFCLPYLYYTYSKTNMLFYWASAGTNSLYIMSTPYENEFGDWKSDDFLLKNPNHSTFMNRVKKLNFIESEKIFNDKAIENITKFPLKYFRNWIANIGRLLFSYPKSYMRQDMNLLYTILPTMFVFVFMSISILISIIKFKSIPSELVFLFLFTVVYLFGSSLVCATRRQFFITMPFWILFISYVFTNIISIKFKYDV